MRPMIRWTTVLSSEPKTENPVEFEFSVLAFSIILKS